MSCLVLFINSFQFNLLIYGFRNLNLWFNSFQAMLHWYGAEYGKRVYYLNQNEWSISLKMTSADVFFYKFSWIYGKIMIFKMLYPWKISFQSLCFYLRGYLKKCGTLRTNYVKRLKTSVMYSILYSIHLVVSHLPGSIFRSKLIYRIFFLYSKVHP